MNCRDHSGFLLEYFAGELPPGVAAEFESHLAACDNCHVFLAQYRETIKLGRGAATEEEKPEVPEDVIRAIVASLKTIERGSS